MHTTRVEVGSDSGRRASLDAEGWHSAERALLDELRSKVPLDFADEDPLYAAAQRADALLGLRIILLKRRSVVGDAVIGNASKLYRALTDTSLMKALTGGAPVEDVDEVDELEIAADEIENNDGPAKPRSTQMRQLRNNRLLYAALLMMFASIAMLAYAFLGM